MVKVERSQPAPASLEKAKEKDSGQYNDRDVMERLNKDFNGKCYICEIKVQDPQVEHLLPHKNGKYKEREYDWDNLFLSCPHCNLVKNKAKYDKGIIDCCKQDPEEVMLFDLDQNKVKVQRLDQSEVVKRTADLVEEVFATKKTGGLTIASENRLKKLQQEMDTFYDLLGQYNENPQNNLIRRALQGLLKRSSEFAGFKRSYITEHKEEYSALYQMLSSL